MAVMWWISFTIHIHPQLVNKFPMKSHSHVSTAYSHLEWTQGFQLDRLWGCRPFGVPGVSFFVQVSEKIM